MLLRVYVQPREEFNRWVQSQTQPAHMNSDASEGQRVFETTACIDCHAVAAPRANGRLGPELTPLVSPAALAPGAAAHTPHHPRPRHPTAAPDTPRAPH